jgi:hypothetical protein
MHLPAATREIIAAAVHARYVREQIAKGVTSRRAPDGEEYLQPWADLSEQARDLDRATVDAVFEGIHQAGYQVTARKPSTAVF